MIQEVEGSSSWAADGRRRIEAKAKAEDDGVLVFLSVVLWFGLLCFPYSRVVSYKPPLKPPLIAESVSCYLCLCLSARSSKSPKTKNKKSRTPDLTDRCFFPLLSSKKQKCVRVERVPARTPPPAGRRRSSYFRATFFYSRAGPDPAG